ncbi:MAG TPA: hypothetical protein VME22_00525 [Solirubrobacteraceae bacterium]|nr:hypothetical protein [Solirubrobacteraceae bacterium]
MCTSPGFAFPIDTTTGGPVAHEHGQRFMAASPPFADPRRHSSGLLAVSDSAPFFGVATSTPSSFTSPRGGLTLLGSALLAGPITPLSVLLSERRALLERRSRVPHHPGNAPRPLARLLLNSFSGRYGTLSGISVHLLRLRIHGEFEPFLGLRTSPLRRLTSALSRAALPCSSIGVSDLLLPAGVVIGYAGALLKLGGRLVQNRREALCGLPGALGRGRGRGSSLGPCDTTFALGGLAADRGPPPQTGRLITLKRLSSARQSRCLVHSRANGHVALIGTTLAPIRLVLSLVRDPLALVGDPLALVGDLLALVCRLRLLARRLHPAEHRSSLLANRLALLKEPGALAFQRLVICTQLRRPSPELASRPRELRTSSWVTLRP